MLAAIASARARGRARGTISEHALLLTRLACGLLAVVMVCAIMVLGGAL